MTRLILLPVSPSEPSGYGKVVAADLESLGGPYEGDQIYVARPTRGMGWLRRLTVGPLYIPELEAHKTLEQDQVFIGDITVFRQELRLGCCRKSRVLRLHNLFLRTLFSLTFVTLLKRPRRNGRFLAACLYYSAMEIRALVSRPSEIIFISQTDRLFFERIAQRTPWAFGTPETSVWSLTPKLPRVIRQIDATKLVWFGGTEGHKLDGLHRFLNQVLPEIRRTSPEVEFHLFGKGTECFHDPARSVHGNGFWSGPDLPFSGQGVFIVPDTVGLGIKVKVFDLIESGCHILSTPEGLIGYEDVSYGNLIRRPLSDWPQAVRELLCRQPDAPYVKAPCLG